MITSLLPASTPGPRSAVINTRDTSNGTSEGISVAMKPFTHFNHLHAANQLRSMPGPVSRPEPAWRAGLDDKSMPGQLVSRPANRFERTAVRRGGTWEE
jgi:hypothetical protein